MNINSLQCEIYLIEANFNLKSLEQYCEILTELGFYKSFRLKVEVIGRWRLRKRERRSPFINN